MGSFSDAEMALAARKSGAAPDLTLVTELRRRKSVLASVLRHELSGNVGLFARASAHDGKTEAFCVHGKSDPLTERGHGDQRHTLAARCRRKWELQWWRTGFRRRTETISCGAVGLGFFSRPTGALNYRSEQIFETYLQPEGRGRNLWLTFDYQYNTQSRLPNADRGPPLNFLRPRLRVAR